MNTAISNYNSMIFSLTHEPNSQFTTVALRQCSNM